MTVRGKKSFIPNNEVLQEYVNATKQGDAWQPVSQAVRASDELLQAVFDGRADDVASGVEKAHVETSQIQYNDENALSYTLSLAFYSARRYYNIIREMPAGKGFADLVFVPRPQHRDKPALVIELKWNHDAETAIRQIKRKRVCRDASALWRKKFSLSASITIKKTKDHECLIEEW